MNQVKAALYTRVSTSQQVDKDSLPFQRQELINYAKYALNIDEVVVFEDAGYSAKNTDRPNYQQMMKRIRNGEFTHLCVWKIDRISRNLKDFTAMYEELQQCKIIFISKNEQFDSSSAMGEAMLKIILVFAELERKLTAERVFSIMLSRAQKGLWNGATVPLGYCWSEIDKFPIIDNLEAITVRLIYHLYEQTYSTVKVADQLNEDKVQTKRNGKWTAKTVRDVLRNPFYIGTYRYNLREKTNSKRRLKSKDEWIILEDNHPAIITKEQFARVNQLLSDNYHGLLNVQRADIHTHVFSRMIYCAKCGGLLTAGLDNARSDGYCPSRYTCNTSSKDRPCTNYISDITLAPFVINYILNLIRLQQKIRANHSLKDVERILLHGNSFIDVVSINTEALQTTYDVLIVSPPNKPYKPTPTKLSYITNSVPRKLEQRKSKCEKALLRLEELYLFDEIGISKEDYIEQKQVIGKELKGIKLALKKSYREAQANVDRPFTDNAKHFLITKALQDLRFINYRKLFNAVGRDIISNFIHTLITKIIVIDKRVQAITFANGITHTFSYKSTLASKRPISQKLHYKSYKDALLTHLEHNGPTSRITLQKTLHITRDGIFTLLNELIQQKQIERIGNSTATRYQRLTHENEV